MHACVRVDVFHSMYIPPFLDNLRFLGIGVFLEEEDQCGVFPGTQGNLVMDQY